DWGFARQRVSRQVAKLFSAFKALARVASQQLRRGKHGAGCPVCFGPDRAYLRPWTASGRSLPAGLRSRHPTHVRAQCEGSQRRSVTRAGSSRGPAASAASEVKYRFPAAGFTPLLVLGSLQLGRIIPEPVANSKEEMIRASGS